MLSLLTENEWCRTAKENADVITFSRIWRPKTYQATLRSEQAPILTQRIPAVVEPLSVSGLMVNRSLPKKLLLRVVQVDS